MAAMVTLTACGAPTTGGVSTHPPAAPPRARASEREPEVAADPRVLPANATFENVLRALAQLDQRPRDRPPLGCLLRPGRRGTGRVEAETALAVRPAPSAPDDLDQLLQTEPGPVRALTRWGQLGEGVYSLALAALTDAVPTRSAVAVVLTDEGVYLRSTARGDARYPLPFPLTRLPERLSSVAPRGARWTAFVTAERETPLPALTALLRALPFPDAEVALAVALPPDTRLPAAAAPAQPRLPSHCPAGLPDSDDAQGALPIGALRAGLRPLRERAGSCMQQARGPAAAGSHVVLRIRITSDGSAREVCLRDARPPDAALARCLLGLAGELRFQPPSPAGSLDIELPLRITPDTSNRQRPLCE